MQDSDEHIHATENRYDRQELISGWDQERLKSASLLIIGSDILANYITLNASSIGFGSIEVFGSGKVSETESDYSKGFLYYEAQPTDSKVKAIANICSLINPDIKITGINLDLSLRDNWNIIQKPAVIIDGTNNPSTKINAANYARRNSIPFVSVSTNYTKGSTGVINPNQEFDKRYLDNILFTNIIGEQGEITSMILSAIAVDEARKSLMLLPGEQTLEDIIVYNKASNSLFDPEEDREVKNIKSLADKHVLQVGAGSEGNFTALGFTLRDVGKLTIIDDDLAEYTNLNRQPFLYGAVDQPKVEALVNKLSKINPRVDYNPIQRRVELNFESYLARNKPDLIIDTVDNNKTRALLNYFSLKYNIPFISGGTRHNSGQAIISVPGKTACLNCKVDIDKLALESYNPQSCTMAAQPSVITSNQIIGGFIVDEAERITAPEIHGEPTNAIIKYISGESLRLGLLPAQETCNCYNKKKLKKWVRKMKHLYKR